MVAEEFPVADEELLAWLEEGLAPARMAEVEAAIRQQPQLSDRVSRLIAERDAGWLSVGEVWRRHRLSCPSRDQLGAYVLGVLEEGLASYIRFHLETVGCRHCQANLEDMKTNDPGEAQAKPRREKIFASSVGFLPQRKL